MLHVPSKSSAFCLTSNWLIVERYWSPFGQFWGIAWGIGIQPSMQIWNEEDKSLIYLYNTYIYIDTEYSYLLKIDFNKGLSKTNLNCFLNNIPAAT